jgi:hypothetical protein
MITANIALTLGRHVHGIAMQAVAPLSKPAVCIEPAQMLEVMQQAIEARVPDS